MPGVADSDEKADLRRYLQLARDALLWKLDGLGEYDVRRPMTPTGTNLLGLVKHAATVEISYFADAFGRPFGEQLPWMVDVGDFDVDALGPDVLVADLWASADESREQIVELYRRVQSHSDATIEALDLDSVGHVPWWPPDRQEVTLRRIFVHMIAEIHRHAGHADILRENIDGAAGLRAGNDNLPTHDQAWWERYRSKLERVAEAFSDS